MSNKQTFTRELIIERLAEIQHLLLSEGFEVGDMPQPQQNQVGAIIGDAIAALQNGWVKQQ